MRFAILAVALVAADASAPRRSLDPRNLGLLRTIAPQAGEIYAAAFSPDGRALALACVDGSVRLFDADEWRETRKIEGPGPPVYALAFAPDGKTLAWAGLDTRIRMWDVPSGRESRMLAGNGQPVSRLAFSPDGRRILSSAADGTARVWEASSGRATAAPRGGAAACFSIDGRRAATGGLDGVIRIWDTSTWEEARALSGHGDAVADLAFSRSGDRLVSCGLDQRVKIWDLRKGVIERTLDGHEGAVTGVAWTDRFIISTGGDATVRLWDAADGRELAVLRHHEGGILGVALSPGGRTFVTVGQDRRFKVWGRVAGGMARVRPPGFCGIRVQNRVAGGGVAIIDVIAETPAHRAGLLPGDLLRRVGGEEIRDQEQSVDLIGSRFEGDELEFIIERDGRERTLKITLGKRPEAAR